MQRSNNERLFWPVLIGVAANQAIDSGLPVAIADLLDP